MDIGVFATNQLAWSAPAFITFYLLPNEWRGYREDGRLEEICYEAGNPHVGLPPSEDLRWLSLGRRLSSGDRSLAGKLLRERLPEAVVTALRRAADELAGRQARWRDLNADPGAKPRADEALRELEAVVRRRVEATQPDGNTIRGAVEKAIVTLAEKPDLFTGNQEAIQTAVKNSGKAADFAAARRRALGFRVLIEDRSGRCRLRENAERLGAGDIALLRDFHLNVFGLALLPEFLERSSRPAFSDPRLTTPKAWRDRHHYDGGGRGTGWTRIANGREYEFDEAGRLLPDGRGGPAVEVKLTRDDATGLLLFAPK